MAISFELLPNGGMRLRNGMGYSIDLTREELEDLLELAVVLWQVAQSELNIDSDSDSDI